MERPLRRSIPLLVELLLCPLVFVLSSAAQKTPAHAAAPHQAIPHFNAAPGSFLGRPAYASRFRHSSPYTSLPFPFFGDSFNPDDIYSTGYPVASQPPISLLQAIRAVAGFSNLMPQPGQAPANNANNNNNDREPRAFQPLVLELQNGRYVRLASTPANGEPLPLTFSPIPTQPKSARAHPVPPPLKIVIPSETSDRVFAIAAPSPPRDLPPALLVFRDGHQEEVRDYTIAGSILYARGDYYSDGYWNKKIDLSTLDVPQTQQANATRNVKFTLPTSPNEVITRP